MEKYTLKVLSNAEFDMLPYKYAQESLGLANPKTKTAYIRKTNIRPLDQFVTEHEISELVSKVSPHEEDGIRYKKVFKEIIAPYVLPVVGALLGGPAGAALGIGATAGGALGGAAASAIGQAGTTGKVQPLPTILSGIGGGLTGAGASSGIAASKAVGGGFLGQTLSGAQSALGIQSGAQKALATGSLSGAGTATSPLQANPIYVTPGATMQEAMTPAQLAAAGVGSAFGKITSSLGSGTVGGALGSSATQGLGFQAPVTGATPAQAQTPITQTFGGTKIGAEAALPQGMGTAGTGMGAGGIATETAKQVSTKTPMLEKLLGANWRQTVLGASIPLLGQSATSMFGATPTPEPFTAEQSQLFNETANMVRQGAQVQLNPAQTQSITAQYDTALEQARQNIMDRYKMLRPGSDIENDSNMREALVELESEFAEKKANALASAQLGLSQTQTQMMSELAAMDIYTLAMKAGIKYQEAKDFKDMLGQMGFMVAKAGQPAIYTNR